ncbi:hypothetical protein Cgig2_002058 [Carnegiea gigantea]|uniref:LysM domain-containing protein n=1 Tax=Carnegiea gigantea TaxID=171969 RepID=A0A9Q1JWL6_9CARY|nr:hypothetical protein Cgig2_002058 [Carnegiea gigantea]
MPWSSVADDREIQTAAFKVPMKLKENVANPSSESFQRDNSLSKSAISRHLDRGDSIASLAIKYRVWVMDMKRLNNIMSNRGTCSRDVLLIPVSNPDILVTCTCYLELDLHPIQKLWFYIWREDPMGSTRPFLCQSKPQIKARRGLVEYLRKSMQVDSGTPHYYLPKKDHIGPHNKNHSDF